MYGLLAGDADDLALSEGANFVHLDVRDLELGRLDVALHACLLNYGDELVLALMTASCEVPNLIVVAAVLTDDNVQVRALDGAVDRGAGGQLPIPALEALACLSSFFLK